MEQSVATLPNKNEDLNTSNKRKIPGAWSFMSAPSPSQIQRGRRAKAFDKPKKAFDQLIVLDFEWTCDNKKFGPPEIIEFPSVLLSGHFPFDFTSEIQYYVKPQVHKKLTEFCMALTAITQANVDSGHGFRETLLLYNQWLKDNGLSSPCIDNESKSSSNRSDSDILSLESPSFCIITWGDSDLGTILKEQCKRLGIEIPIHFHQWINLKALFKQHFGWEPHGGLQNVVERLGFVFEGRAHSGLVDSRNTAKIVKKMLEEGYKFTRATRNIHAYKEKPQ